MKTLIINDPVAIEGIIRSCRVCFMGMTEADGSPYVIPMSFGYEGGVFYFHSGKEGRKSLLLKTGTPVCLTLSTGDALIFQHPEVACSYSMVAQSVICKGSITMIEDRAEKTEALNKMMKFYTSREFSYSVPALDNVLVWKVSPDQITCKSFGNRMRVR